MVDHLRSLLRGLGLVLVTLGLLTLSFAGYQLWGTGVEEARAQSTLAAEFERTLAAPPASAAGVDDPVVTGPSKASPASAPAPRPERGEAVARMEIPRIGLERVVVEGVQRDDLKRGPGHYPETPLFGEEGNVAVAGHRTTYGSPFARLDELEVGDEIVTETPAGRFVYVVTGQEIVSPSDVSVIAPSEGSTLTLTTCHPRYSARQRLVVFAELRGDPLPVPAAAEAPLADAALEEPGAPSVEEGPVDPSSTVFAGEDLSGDPSARLPALLWGSVLALVLVAGMLLSRRWGRLRSWPIAALPVLVSTFLLFEQVNRLLPANL